MRYRDVVPHFGAPTMKKSGTLEPIAAADSGDSADAVILTP